MGNQFYGFSPESFEQFARALAIAIFGPGVKAFGNGPDGGREAIFRGEVPYPFPPATRWAGYGVIQAKCKEKAESTQKDQEWALGLLEAELQSFVASEKRHPKPEYYVFVTNVELSSASGGGNDRAEKILQSYYGRLPLKGHAVWDANQLTALLATQEGVRRRFREFLATGDLLSAMLSQIEQAQPNAIRTLSLFLERELRADEVARLDQAGNRTDEQLRLAQLFFDLPSSTQPEIVPPEETVDDSGRLPHGTLWEMLRDGSRKLDPEALYEQETSSPQDPDRFPARYVLLGGPGSGKSTLVQFLAQIHRSALLMRRPPKLLEPRTRRILEETRQLCDREGLPWPATPRYPFRVDLNRFAKILASQEHENVRTLADYLFLDLKTEPTIHRRVLFEWLATYPSILILDGLDEVPITSNRDHVIQAVEDYLSEARQEGADIFVVATSRHQGYAGEFSGGIVALRHILPLSAVRALRYVEAYANARFGASNPAKVQEVVSKLSDSIQRQLTAQLMGSPLQVTFMATVVAARGDPGEDRWQLFESYYRTIYDRERQKAVPPYDAVLSKQQPTIDRLHHDIGFWLQYRGETASDKGVTLTIGDFEKLVDSYLGEIGREGEDKENLVSLITDAARHRLVFLTSRIAGELSFDVRSLQEYMAAECLTSGEPGIVQARLKAIAPASYWRNVFLFAASKCFVDARSRHLQDSVRVLCEDLNSSTDHLFAATKAGSELALDILQSGAVAENPNYSRHLARTALELLQQPYISNEEEEGPSTDQRLAVVYRNYLEGIYREVAQLWIGQAEISRALGTWPLLIRLSRQGINWVDILIEKSWPTEQACVIRLAPVLPGFEEVLFLRRRVEEFLLNLKPSEALLFFRSLRERGSNPFGSIFDIVLPASEVNLHLPDPKVHAFRVKYNTVRGSQEAKDAYQRVFQLGMHASHSGWLPLIWAIKVLDSPDMNTLAQLLETCADGGWEPDASVLWWLPWPISNALCDAKGPDDLRVVARDMRTNAASVDWIAIERSWEARGFSLGDIEEAASPARALDVLVGGEGIPVITGLAAEWGPLSPKAIKGLYETARRIPASVVGQADVALSMACWARVTFSRISLADFVQM